MNYKKRIKKWIKEQKLLAALGAACLVSLIAMAIILANPKTVQAPFEAPAYEQSAEKGEPKVPEIWMATLASGRSTAMLPILETIRTSISPFLNMP